MFDGFNNVWLQNQLVMIGAELACDDACEIGFVEIVVLEADRKSLDRARTSAGHQGNHGRRIGSAAEKCAQRNIRDQADTSRLKQAALQFLQAFLFALGQMCAVLRKVPVLADINLPVSELQQMSRWQLVDSGEDCDRVWYVAVIQVFEQALRIDFG